jgi:hypothetical protein
MLPKDGARKSKFGKTLCDPTDWNARHQEFLTFTPAKLHPNPGPHGEHSYSKNITIGKRGHDCRVEVSG